MTSEMTVAAAVDEFGVLLVSLCDCDLGPVLAEIGDRAEVETVRLAGEPTRASVDGLLARLRGRRLAVYAEDTVELDQLVLRFRDGGEPVPFALLPCATDPPGLNVAGAPGAGETGTRQLLAGQPEAAGILRGDHGAAAVRDIELVRQGNADELPFDAHVLVDGGEVFAGRVDGARLAAEGDRVRVECTHDDETLVRTGAEVVVKAAVPVEARGCVGPGSARLRHTWTVEPAGFAVYTAEPADPAAGELPRFGAEPAILLLTAGDSDISEVHRQLEEATRVEVARLPARPSRADVEAALGRAKGRRVAIRAGCDAFDLIVDHLLSSPEGARTPLAVLPDPAEPIYLGPENGPCDESGAAQALGGVPHLLPVLRDENGALAVSGVNLWDARSNEDEVVPFAVKITVDATEVYDGVSDGRIVIDHDFDGFVNVEFGESDDRVRRSGETVTVESPVELEAVDTVGVKASGQRHVWASDPDGFTIYDDYDEDDEETDAAESLAEEEKRVKREQLLAEPPPETTSTRVLLLRMIVPILLVCGIPVTAFAVFGTIFTDDAATIAFCAGGLIVVSGYQLGGKYRVDRVALALVAGLYLVVGATDGEDVMQNLAVRLTGQEIEAVVADEGFGGSFIVADGRGHTLAYLDGDYAVGDRVTMVVDPNHRLDPQTLDEMNTGYPAVAATLLLGSAAGLFVLSGLTWRQRRRENYAKYLAIRDEAAMQAAT